MAEGQGGGWLPPRDDDDERTREQQGGMSSGDPLWSGPQQPQPEPPAPPEEYGGFQPPTQSGWTPPPASAQPGGQWNAGPQQPYYGPQPTSNGKATAALVCGIIGIVVCPIVFSVAALVLGYQARKEIDASQGRQQNRGLATAGIITGWVGLAFGILLIILVVAGVIAGLNGETTDGGGSLFGEPAITLIASALPI